MHSCMSCASIQSFSVELWGIAYYILDHQCPISFPSCLQYLGRSLKIGDLENRLKGQNLETLKGCPLVTLSVCLSVCELATGHTFWPRNLIFGLSDLWDMRKKLIFLFFEIFIFTLFIGMFRFFPYITVVNFGFQATSHNFSPRNMIFGYREPCPIRNWRLLKKIENFIFYGKGGHFSDFLAIFQYNFGDS